MPPRPFRAQVGSNTRINRTLYSGTASTIQSDSARIGMQAVIRNYAELIRYIGDVTPEILLEALEPTYELSQEYCPIDTGDLKKSGYLEIVNRGDHPRVEIGYGKGGDPSYTVTVHENLEWRHKAPTRAKWLQIALEEDAPNIQKRIQSAYRSIL